VSLFSPMWRRRATRHDDRGLESLLTDGFVAIDLETTGLDPRRDAIVEIAAVPFVGGRAREGYVTHVDPERPIPPESTRVHGITEAMVAGAPTASAALVELERVCADHILVGHGIAFDMAMLGRARRARRLRPLTNPSFDTRRLAAALHPDWDRFELDDVAARLGIGVLGRHTAEGDARAAGELLLVLLQNMSRRSIRTVGDLLWFQESVAKGP
jgi:DNA polymerase-3 subunit epsilon